MKNTSLQEPLTREAEVKLFIKEFGELCQKRNCQIINNPAWKISQDTGTWSMIIQSSIGKLPEDK